VDQVKNSRDLKDLLPPVYIKALAFVAECKAEGIDVLITSTLRDAESQNALYAQGRTTPGKIVTNAKAGQSWHNFACAFDFVPIVNGKAQWDDLKTFERCGRIAEAVGLEWAGRWSRFKELAHCQYTGGLTMDDLRAGKTVV
jgi:peptidoglycan L-alanyl-D-glutamate endopeptidase CwlK